MRMNLSEHHRPRYQSIGTGHIETKITNEKSQSEALLTDNKDGISDSSSSSGEGLTVLSAAIFIAGEMAGSGVLALPRAVVDAGWIGLLLLVIFCVNAGYGGSRLGACWDIIEERYPQNRERVRNPYSRIATHAVGRWAGVLVSGCIQFTLFGAGTVYLQLAAQIVQDMLSDYVQNISVCLWFLIIAALLMVPMWLGSPKDFWWVGVGALLTTAMSCVLIFAQMLLDARRIGKPAVYKKHGFGPFFLSFGVILFAFGGASTFPTIQNDMVHKQKFSTSVVIAFTVILLLYLPVTIGGYLVYGEDVEANVLLSLGRGYFVAFANIFMAIHLVLAFLIVVNPVCQELEEIFQVPHKFGLKRCVIRSLMLIVMTFVGESIPKFGQILSLVGGSTITLLTFVFPSLFYMILCDQTKPEWPQRTIPAYVRVYMWELIVIGLIGGAASTYNAIDDIFGSHSVTTPCYWPY